MDMEWTLETMREGDARPTSFQIPGRACAFLVLPGLNGRVRFWYFLGCRTLLWLFGTWMLSSLVLHSLDLVLEYFCVAH